MVSILNGMKSSSSILYFPNWLSCDLLSWITIPSVMTSLDSSACLSAVLLWVSVYSHTYINLPIYHPVILMYIAAYPLSVHNNTYTFTAVSTIADYCSVVHGVGYRHVHLLSDKGEPLDQATIFVHIACENPANVFYKVCVIIMYVLCVCCIRTYTLFCC